MSLWMIERQFRLNSNHPTHGGYVTPIRGAVEANSEEEAQTKANAASDEALAAIGGVGKGEWAGDAIVLYEMDTRSYYDDFKEVDDGG